jgi:hypothetical protein
MVRLPDDLRRELESALGHPVPEALSQEEIKALGKEVSAKAPGLFRAVADLVGNEVRQAAKRKPESRAARPSGLARYFYVQDKDGNWVPSRARHIALLTLVASGFFGFTYFMISSPSKPTGAAQAPAAAAPVPAPPPLVQAAEEGKEGVSTAENDDEASFAERTQGQGAGSGSGTLPPPPSPLPGPNPNLPPPPDYVPIQEGQAQMEGLTVVYSRNSGGAAPGEGQGAAVQGAAFYARPKVEGEAGLALTPTRPPSQTQGQGGEGEGKVAGSFWARSREDGSGLFSAPTSVLAQGEGKEASGGLEVQVLRGKSEGEGGGSAGLQVYTPRAGSSQAETGGGEAGGARGKGLEVSAPAKPGEVQVVWRRNQGEVRGGIVPPGGQGISTPGVGSGSKVPSSAPSESGGEGSAVPPPSPGGSP